ncbi:SDR family oxidoreductase [soil metagenome]
MTSDLITSSDWLGLRGARVLVAGVGGIGAACARGYADQGASVLVVDRDHDKIQALKSAEDGLTPLDGIVADLTSEGEAARVVDTAVERLGGLDVLLHSVGVNDRRPVLDFTVDDFEQMMRVNLVSAFSLAQAAGRHMTAAGKGRIVMVSSVSGLLAHAKHGPYAASKGGLNQLMRVMAHEWAASGVTVNAVAPGYVETHLTSDYLERPGVREDITALVPAGRLGTPGELVGPVLFLSSPHAAFVTGHVLYVDGGRTLV